jgi:hypothetical protein
MNDKQKDLDQILDQAIAEIRDDQLDPQFERAAADQVWQRLSQEIAQLSPEEPESHQIRDCSDFQALIPAYLQGGLKEAKALLLQDHVGECVPCRRALKQARAARRTTRVIAAPSQPGWLSTWGWRVAAAAVIVVALVGLNVSTDVFTFKTGGLIRVERIDGEVFRVTDDGSAPLSVGDTIDFEDVSGIRTAKESGAILRLADNSLVEMNERSELAVANRRKIWRPGRGDTVIDLARGAIIVEAADQESGQLLVDTADAEVAVTGTVFSVNHGIKGSRVSVIEGEVQVAHSGRRDVLTPGQQSTTSPNLRCVPVEREIAWSENRERHLRVLHQLTKAAQEIEQALTGPGIRYRTNLLDLAPQDTVIYAGIPNVSGTLSQGYEMLLEKIDANDLLRDWWNQTVVNEGADLEIQALMDRVRNYGEQLGDEIVIAVHQTDQQNDASVVMLAELKQMDGFAELLAADIDKLSAEEYGQLRLRILEGEQRVPSDLGGADESPHFYLWFVDDLLVASPELEGIERFAADLQQRQSGFVGSEFHARLADLYDDGVAWLVGFDVATLLLDSPERDRETMEQMGLLDMQHVIVERKDVDDGAENRAVLTFDQPRQGLASWLAAPAPMGSLDFISAEASIAAAFVMEEPTSVVEQLFGFLRSVDTGFEQRLAEFERENGIDIRKDVAAALGGEFAMALDGPLVPIPSWKLVMEVYDPGRLQGTLEWAVGRLNELASENDIKGFIINEVESAGRIFYQIESLDTGLSAHYVFVDGFMVASASRGLLERSLQFRDSGLTLAASSRFARLLPTDGQVNFSAVVYQNLGSILGPLSHAMGSITESLNPEQQKLMQELGDMTAPSLTLAYGEPERITFVNKSDGGLISSGIASLLRFEALMDVQQLLGQAARSQAEESGAADRNESDVDVEQFRIKG